MNFKALSMILITLISASTSNIESSFFTKTAAKLGVTTKELGQTVAAGIALTGTAIGLCVYQDGYEETITKPLQKLSLDNPQLIKAASIGAAAIIIKKSDIHHKIADALCRQHDALTSKYGNIKGSILMSVGATIGATAALNGGAWLANKFDQTFLNTIQPQPLTRFQKINGYLANATNNQTLVKTSGLALMAAACYGIYKYSQKTTETTQS